MVIKIDPLAAEPKWYFNNLQVASRTGESVGFLNEQMRKR